MYPVAIGCFFIVAILILGFGLRSVIKRHRLKRQTKAAQAQAPLDTAMDLIGRAEKGDLAAADELLAERRRGHIKALGSEYLRWLRMNLSEDWVARAENIWAQTFIRHEYEHEIESLRQRYATWQESLETATFQEKIAAGAQLHWILNHMDNANRLRICEELGVSLEAIAANLVELAQEEVDQLWKRALDSREAYLELRLLILTLRKGKIPGETRYSYSELPSRIKLPWPEGWNEKTVEYLDDPEFSDFDTQEIQPGEAHRRAVEIRHSRDWLDAAILLAYLRSNKQAREEVGQHLRNQLQEMVVTHRRSLVEKTS